MSVVHFRDQIYPTRVWACAMTKHSGHTLTDRQNEISGLPYTLMRLVVNA